MDMDMGMGMGSDVLSSKNQDHTFVLTQKYAKGQDLGYLC